MAIKLTNGSSEINYTTCPFCSAVQAMNLTPGRVAYWRCWACQRAWEQKDGKIKTAPVFVTFELPTIYDNSLDTSEDPGRPTCGYCRSIHVLMVKDGVLCRRCNQWSYWPRPANDAKIKENPWNTVRAHKYGNHVSNQFYSEMEGI